MSVGQTKWMGKDTEDRRDRGKRAYCLYTFPIPLVYSCIQPYFLAIILQGLLFLSVFPSHVTYELQAPSFLK